MHGAWYLIGLPKHLEHWQLAHGELDVRYDAAQPGAKLYYCGTMIDVQKDIIPTVFHGFGNEMLLLI